MISATTATPGPRSAFAASPSSISPAATSPCPMRIASKFIIYNGEIFNHADLRPDLEQAGHRYANRSDTETILHAYEQYGPDCVQRFRGMFAFAIWDQNARKLFCARDRLGIKPLLLLLGRPHCSPSPPRSRRCCEHPAISPAVRRIAAPGVPRLRLHQRRAHALPRTSAS